MKIHAVAGELSDDELEAVVGGGCGQSMPQRKFQVGDHVRCQQTWDKRRNPHERQAIP